MDNINLSYSKYIPTYAGQPVEDIKLANKELAEKYIKNKSDMDALSVAAANIEVNEKDLQYKNQAIQDIDSDITGILDDGNYEYATNKVTNSAKKFFSNQALPKAQEAYKELKTINAAVNNRKDLNDFQKAKTIEINNKNYSGVKPVTNDPRDGYTYDLNPLNIGEYINGTETVIKNLFNHFEYDSTSKRYKPKAGSSEFLATTGFSDQWITKEELMNTGINYLKEHQDYQNRYKPEIKVNFYDELNKGTYNQEYLIKNKATIDENGYVTGDGIFVAPEYKVGTNKGFSNTTVVKRYTPEEAYSKLKNEVLAEHTELRGNAKENQQLIDNYIKEKSEYNKQVYNDVNGAAVAKSFRKTSNETIWEEDQTYANKQRQIYEDANKPYDATNVFTNPASNTTGYATLTDDKNWLSKGFDLFMSGNPGYNYAKTVFKNVEKVKSSIENNPNVDQKTKDKFNSEYGKMMDNIRAFSSSSNLPFTETIVNNIITDNTSATINNPKSRSYDVIKNHFDGITSNKGLVLNNIDPTYNDKIQQIYNKAGYKKFDDLSQEDKMKVTELYTEGIKTMSRQDIFNIMPKSEVETLSYLNAGKTSIKHNGEKLSDIIGNQFVGNYGNSKMIYDTKEGEYKTINQYLKDNPGVIVKSGGRFQNTNFFKPGSHALYKSDGTILYIEGTDQDQNNNYNEWSTYQVDNNVNKDVTYPLYYKDTKTAGGLNYETKESKANVPQKRIVLNTQTGNYDLYILNHPNYNSKSPIVSSKNIEDINNTVNQLNPNKD